MALSSLFYGMEAYLDGDVEINNNVGAADTAATASSADQSAEIASDVADANSEAKDSEIQAEMLIQMSKLYTHVKTYGIDRTFLSIYNANHELDHMCGVRFPSCESFAVTGNPHSQYSARFIAAMEDENTGFWHKVKSVISSIWEWIRRTVLKIWYKITALFGKKIETLEQYTERFKKLYKDAKELDCYGILGKLHDSERNEVSNIDEISNTLTRLCDNLSELGRKANSLATWCENRISDTEEESRNESDYKIKSKIDEFAKYSKRITGFSKILRNVLDTIHVDSNASTGKCSASDIIPILEYFAKTLPDIVRDCFDTSVASAKDGVSNVFSKVSSLKALGPKQAETGELILNYVKGYQDILQKLPAITVELSNLTTDVLESLKNIINKN